MRSSLEVSFSRLVLQSYPTSVKQGMTECHAPLVTIFTNIPGRGGQWMVCVTTHNGLPALTLTLIIPEGRLPKGEGNGDAKRIFLPKATESSLFSPLSPPGAPTGAGGIGVRAGWVEA